MRQIFAPIGLFRDANESSRMKKRRLKSSLDGVSGQRWIKMYLRLVLYNKEHGNTRVPKGLGQLHQWVWMQRERYKSKQLPEERKALLTSIGFVWDAREGGWARWIVHKPRHGGAKAPLIYCQDPQLGHWIRTQRTNHRSVAGRTYFRWSVRQVGNKLKQILHDEVNGNEYGANNRGKYYTSGKVNGDQY